MLKLKPVASALAALMIASALSGCGGAGVEPVSKTGGDAQITADAVAQAAKAAEVAAAAKAAKAAEAVAAAKAAKAVEVAAAAEAATVAKAAAEAKARAVAKAKAAAAAKAKTAAAAAAAAPPPVASIYYENCTAVRAAGADPILRGDPGYSSKLDRDGDGIACDHPAAAFLASAGP